MMPTARTSQANNVCLKITLQEVLPPVVRRVEVPTNIALSDLHLVIQAVMPWTNTHLYEFRANDVGWGVPDPDFRDGPRDSRETTLGEALKTARRNQLMYLYDFGDGWEHAIVVEYMIAPDPKIKYPILLEATGRCPPEDVGGPPGYEEFLDAIIHPKKKRHTEMITWHGSPFDPTAVDVDAIKTRLRKIARRLSRAKARTTPKK